MTDDPSPFGPLLFAYSRAQAIADGVLVDVTPLARAADFKVPVAVTAAVWARCIEVPDGVRNESELLKQWNLFWHVHHAIRRAREGASRVTFQIDTRTNDGREGRVELVAAIAPGDNGEPVMTIMFSDED